MSYQSFQFEVHGKVQGVSFRAYTQQKARTLEVVGWVQNTPSGTVRGIAQGSSDGTNKMKKFLKEEGSPYSRIDSCDITAEKSLDKLEFQSFSVR